MTATSAGSFSPHAHLRRQWFRHGSGRWRGACQCAFLSRRPRTSALSPALLVDERGAPFNGRSLQPRTNYLFHFPFVATPCLLIDLARDVGGGRGCSIVAFSAICSHQLAYPAKEVSFIRFQAKASTHSEAERIHCCADHSVYDPAQGARCCRAGTRPLAQIELSYDAKTGNLTATGLRGTDQFDAFFRKYDFKLGMEFGGRARDLVGDQPIAGADALLPQRGAMLTAAADQAVVVRDLRKSHGASEAVRGISFSVGRGQTVALLGGNGAGKTTTLSMLLGVLTPSSGSIELLGLPLAQHRYDILPRINFTSPYVDLPKRLSVVENLRVFAGLYGVDDARQRIAELIAEL